MKSVEQDKQDEKGEGKEGQRETRRGCRARKGDRAHLKSDVLEDLDHGLTSTQNTEDLFCAAEGFGERRSSFEDEVGSTDARSGAEAGWSLDTRDVSREGRP